MSNQGGEYADSRGGGGLPIKRGPAFEKEQGKKNADRQYVKWLGVIFDDSLDFDIHWKSRLAKKA